MMSKDDSRSRAAGTPSPSGLNSSSCLGICTSDEDVVASVLSGPHARVRARAVLDAAGGLGGMARLSVEELARIEGVGRASARVLAASVELCRRFVRAEIEGRPSVTCPADVARLVRAQLVGAMAEHFMAVGLNARHRVVMFEVIAVGSLGHVDVHPRELFRRAVSTGVHSMVLAHNHPSGSPSPSDADVALTRRMVEVGALLGIPVLDHVIVASGGDASLAALGMMDVA